MQKKYEEELYKLALKAYKRNEVPVAAIVVYKNKIISKAFNNRKKTTNPLDHAEVKAIIRATKKIGDWRLSECDVYVSLEPCHMCKEIIKESRIKNVYYFMENDKVINFKSNFVKIDNNASIKFKDLLTNFFKNLR